MLLLGYIILQTVTGLFSQISRIFFSLKTNFGISRKNQLWSKLPKIFQELESLWYTILDLKWQKTKLQGVPTVQYKQIELSGFCTGK